MPAKRLRNILLIGWMCSYSLGILVILFQMVMMGDDVPVVLWFILLGNILLVWQKFEWDKMKDESKLAWVERTLLLLNLITFIYGLGAILITLNDDWLAKEIRYAGLAIGLPSLVAMIYWWALKNGVSKS
jgi:hypothetical protein